MGAERDSKAARRGLDLRTASFALIGACALAAVVLLAMHRASPPERCAPGMTSLGPRCCGRGQTLEDGHCRGEPQTCAEGMGVTEVGCVPNAGRVPIAGGLLRVAPTDWEAAQQRVKHYQITVAAFAIDSHEVTEGQYGRCVDAGACASPADADLAGSGEPGRALAGVTLAEAERYCRWRGGALPTLDQWRLAAMGTAGHRYPWGETGAVCRRAAFGLADGPCAHGADGPELAGSHPDGASPESVHDLAGNVAEWTAPIANGDGELEAGVVGGSWRDATATELRTWYRRPMGPTERAPDVGLRCVYATGP